MLAFVFAGAAVPVLEEFARQRLLEQAVVEAAAAAAGLAKTVANVVTVTTRELLGEAVKGEPPPPKPVPMAPPVVSADPEMLPFHEGLGGPGRYVP